ncbi:GH1 family beta-glucosidase [Microbacterium sp. H1-D42]|uniref:GH1 family beta-glucosidase n=1 Tax=Microbacterium sp. H1-D42 TaxID=2925844 RepID=UPI001F532035|nr:GH1 family beta-glucosidase [Microbacterium sp. H1-D42]UNK72073.1 GH1 family beta-glucosidase [Microbacterium sp. H1-D42]
MTKPHTPVPRRSDFPADFRFGTATAAFQIEGALTADGRTPSIWDTFSTLPGAIRDGHTADLACDHYHRLDEDLDLLADLGAQAYRFSLSWTRILSGDDATVNRAGVDFYRRLVDGLRERNIAPMATVFHWDLPQRLQDRGGWTTRDAAHRLAEFAAVAAREIDGVDTWITLNEPYNHMSHGHIHAVHAPGLRLGTGAAQVAHHLLLGHGLSVQALRAETDAAIGIANYYSPARPALEHSALGPQWDAWVNHLFTDPLLRGEYPAEIADFAPIDRFVRDGDLQIIAQPIDVLGVNFYRPSPPIPTPHGAFPFALGQFEDGAGGVSAERTGFDWPIVPDALRDLLTGLKARYGDAVPPIEITENGAAFVDVVRDGVCDDPERLSYIQQHLAATAQAIDAGVDVRGYYLWSLMDNFEWAAGYTQRFGIVHVDFATQTRTRKASFQWYRDLVRGADA